LENSCGVSHTDHSFYYDYTLKHENNFK